MQPTLPSPSRAGETPDQSGQRARPRAVAGIDFQTVARPRLLTPESRAGGSGINVALPQSTITPIRAILRRMLIALSILVGTVLIVYVDREGYRDSNGDGLSLLDAAYYTTVTLSTTGYGDIAPFSDSARLANIILVTPLRVMFLIILVGTTLEVLTERGRMILQVNRWRSRVRDHVVVCGYGTKGRSAIRVLLGEGIPAESIVIVDADRGALEEARAAGFAVVAGSSTRSEVLREAQVHRARAVVIATDADDSAVLTTLTARELSAKVNISVAVRESENAHLLRQSGANSVVVSSETSGRLLGLSSSAPLIVNVVEDLLTSDAGLAIIERPVHDEEIGKGPRFAADPVLAVVRDGAIMPYADDRAWSLRAGDRLICVKSKPPAEELESLT
ncbi:MAG: potassium channel family protein [Geodermatophilaceae bacterium]|nr:potassium channel family protein [Geodermatophilaceae bacterium]